MADFAQWLMGMLSSLVEWLYNGAIDLLQYLIDLIPAFIASLAEYLPTSSPSAFPVLSSAPSDSETWRVFVGALNWIFPLSYTLQLFSAVVVALVLYIALAPLLRWAKLLN